MGGPPWTQAEINILRQTCHLTAAVVGQTVGRGTKAVQLKRRSLGLLGTASRYPLEIGSRTLVAKTCNRCGLLLDATWFSKPKKSKSRGQAHCKACFNQLYRRRDPVRERQRYEDEGSERSAARQRAMQAVSLPTATRHREEWTDADMKVLENPDLTRLEKAIIVHRTFYATADRLTDFRLPSKAGKGDPVLAQWIIDNPNFPADADSDQARIVEAWQKMNETDSEAA